MKGRGDVKGYERVDAVLLRLRRDLCSVFATFWNGTETVDEDANLWVFVKLWEQTVKDAAQVMAAVPAEYVWPVEHEVQRVAWGKARKAALPDPSWRNAAIVGWLREVVFPVYEELQKGQQATLLVAGQQPAGLLPDSLCL